MAQMPKKRKKKDLHYSKKLKIVDAEGVRGDRITGEKVHN